MQTSDREDYLEWILENQVESLDDETLRLIAQKTDKTVDDVRGDLQELSDAGDITLGPGDSVILTEQGRKTAECVLKKHKVLECFLTEMLGMDQDTASEQACRMEHDASDDTISRLDQYLSRPRWCRQEHRRGCRQWRDAPSLSQCSEGDTVRVAVMRGACRMGRLNDIGVVPGEVIHIQRKLSNGSLVVAIKGSDIAISPEIAASVLVEPVE